MGSNNTVAVLFISGQSNAHAHGRFMEESDRIMEPMKNVFSLDRNPNRSFDITDVVWSGYTTEGKNLGESQDHTYTLASFVAKYWQNAIDEGIKLPDLYIVQISIGGQGIVNGMWNPDKEKIMNLENSEEIDISLFPWAIQVNQLVMKNLKQSGKRPEVIGWHWIGSEQEVWDEAYKSSDFVERYDTFFDAMMESIGQECPMYFYKLYLQNFCRRYQISTDAVQIINEALLRQCKRYPDATWVETEQCSLWDRKDPHCGIFAPDDGHYLEGVQEWFAKRFIEELHNRYF